MFKELMPLVEKNQITLQLKALPDGRLSVLVGGKSASGAGASFNPIILVDTPENLDEHLSAALSTLVSSVVDLNTLVEQQKAILDDKKTEVAKTTAKAASKTTPTLKASHKPPVAAENPSGEDLKMDDDSDGDKSLEEEGSAESSPSKAAVEDEISLF